jgi:hypothetical protein
MRTQNINYEIDEFFSLNGYGPHATLVISVFGQDDIEFIMKNKDLIKDFNFRKSIINIYYRHCFLHVNNIQKAFGIEIKNDEILMDALNYIVNSADITLNLKNKDFIETKIKLVMRLEKYMSHKKERRKKINEYFYSEMKELKVKSIFYSEEEFDLIMRKHIESWLFKKIEEDNFKQRIYDELPELIIKSLEIDKLT